MAKQTLKFRVIIIFALIAISAAFVLSKYLALRDYQRFIHEHYSAEIQQLEAAMMQWPEDRFQDVDTYKRVEALHDELRQTFGAGDFYHASWSIDSHHGLHGTDLPGSGFSVYPWVSTTDDTRQSLYYGTSSDGVPLLVYERWLTDTPVMRHIQIVLYRDKVNQSIKAEKFR